jgi:S1-C subfamily serine protease
LAYNDLAVGLHWFNELTFSLLFPIVAPAYVQATGVSARTILEKDLRVSLQEIMGKIVENRIVFTPAGDPFLPRRDEPYKEYLKKTVFLELPNGHGTGFFISSDGYILTNAHVVDEYRVARFYLYEDLPFIPYRAEPPFRYARLIKLNKSRDLALLKAEGEYPYFKLDDDRSHYQTGQTVLTLGNPQDKMWTMSQGIISAVHNHNGTDEIQIDSSVNPGNSGGPLVLKSTGEVIGVISRGIAPSAGSGIGYAISVFEVLRTLEIDPELKFFPSENTVQEQPKV